MDTPSHSNPEESTQHSLANAHDPLIVAIHDAAHVLPTQGPIGVFIHHNTLHAYQHQRFHDGIIEAYHRLGGEPYRTERAFQNDYAKGRITHDDLVFALDENRDLFMNYDAGATEPLPFAFEKLDPITLRIATMLLPFELNDPHSVRWYLDEHPEIETSSLWNRCGLAITEYRDIVEAQRNLKPQASFATHRDLLLRFTGEDCNTDINPFLIRLCAAYLDHGMAYWPMPEHREGLYPTFRNLMLTTNDLPLPAWFREFHDELRDSSSEFPHAIEIVRDALHRLGVAEADYLSYLERMLLALPGWAGMIHFLEQHPEEDSPPVALVDFLAIQLTLTCHAVKTLAERRIHFQGDLATLYAVLKHKLIEQEQRKQTHHSALKIVEQFRLFQACRSLQLTDRELESGSPAVWPHLIEEILSFDNLKRRRIWQDAYERHYREQILNALRDTRSRNVAEGRSAQSPDVQILTCIDDREESFRRHLEESVPNCETFGTAGFFGLAVEYRGLDDSRHRNLCPVIVQPTHAIVEQPASDADGSLNQLRQSRRKLWAQFSHWLYVTSRSAVRGTLLNAALGGLSLVPFALRILFPRRLAQWRRALSSALLPPLQTQLTSTRSIESPDRDKPIGYTVDEQSAKIAALLQNIGLTEAFSPLIVILGHGSSSVNNPHASAYDCGACGGGRGGPNARLLATIANTPDVRQKLREQGIQLPESSYFVGGMHDTCSDTIHWYDLERMPESHRRAFETFRETLIHVRRTNAHERCRRFENVPLTIAPQKALAHVEARAESLGEPRPEYNHATNACCIIGRRTLTRNLFLDRRALLVSYDPTSDRDGVILERTLSAVGPVCAGINLEYYFSTVDNERYGCGTKLPHNVTGLIGVMNGHASDLRTGLWRQTVEIHEPMRLLLVVESTPERLVAIAKAHRELSELIFNEWVQLVTISPHDGTLHRFREGSFAIYEPNVTPVPTVESSMTWYQGRRDFLGPARIDPARTATRALSHAA